ncbi:unnamed protein product [Soboliphyme baturini]|uniref:C2H2-type domain-containing protein n=1 Tax=Soboliphyme baturini TaxID=241478 RepID=A0A183IPX4_9BILA|nr:unnamed protein product [Soboliphyme baturini]
MYTSLGTAKSLCISDHSGAVESCENSLSDLDDVPAKFSLPEDYMLHFSCITNCGFSQCELSGLQEHYHCKICDLKNRCSKVCTSFSSVQLHASSHHRPPNPLQPPSPLHNDFKKTDADELCHFRYCPFMAKNLFCVHYHCLRPGCSYAFKNGATGRCDCTSEMTNQMVEHKRQHEMFENASQSINTQPTYVVNSRLLNGVLRRRNVLDIRPTDVPAVGQRGGQNMKLKQYDPQQQNFIHMGTLCSPTTSSHDGVSDEGVQLPRSRAAPSHSTSNSSPDGNAVTVPSSSDVQDVIHQSTVELHRGDVRAASVIADENGEDHDQRYVQKQVNNYFHI